MNPIQGQVLREGLKAAKNGPPVKPGKSPVLAFFAGFFFGPIGSGIYLESWQDFFVPLLILIIASVCTGGIAAPLAWMFCGLYAAGRCSESQ